MTIVGSFFAGWGLLVLSGPFLMKSDILALLFAPCTFVGALGPLVLAAISFGMVFGFHRRVLDFTRCQFCRKPVVLAEVRECAPDYEGPEYTEYLFRCPHCGGERVVVDA